MKTKRKFTAHGVEEYEYRIGSDMDIWADDIGDEYHTLHDLYQHRLALTVALFHAWQRLGISVCKARLHSDGTMFDGGYFVVVASTDQGQISYHYKLDDWDKFQIPISSFAPEYDGHTPAQTLERLVAS